MMAAIRHLARGRRLWIWIGLGAALGIGFGWLPLFGVLGFELALAIAVFGSIAGVDLGAALARELQWEAAAGGSVIDRSRYAGRTLAGTTLAASVLAVIVALVPGMICAVRGLWVPTCDWAFGLLAYAAMPVASAALAGALGHAIGIAVGARPREPRRHRPHRSTVLAIVPLLLLAIASLVRFYTAPPVFTYNAIIGYFPGNLYDENVRLQAALGWARLEQLAWVIAIVAVVATRLDVPSYRARLRARRPVARRIAAWVIAVVAAAGGVALHLDSGALGYAVDAEDIEQVLAGRLETAHFTIHYPKTRDIEKDLALIAEDHEFRYAQVVKRLGVAPAGKLRSFYFADRDQKARWHGARDVEMAKPWRHEIYIDHRGFPEASLRHEIAHAVAAEFGDPIFGVAARRVLGIPILISPGLVEGLAVATDWPGGYDGLTPHEAVRAMEEMGMTPSIGQLLSLRFLTVSSSRGYTTAGSFLEFLLARYGAPALRALYASGGDFAGAYHKAEGELEAEWRAMIETIELPPAVVEGVRERFRTGSVFSRPCPHANAARREKAREKAAHGDRRAAVELMRATCQDAPEEPNYRIVLGDYLVDGGGLERAEAITLWTAIADDGENVSASVRAKAIERLAYAANLRGDRATQTALIDRGLALPSDPEEKRQLEAKSFVLHHDGPAGTALRAYFFAPAGVLGGQGWALLATLAEPDLGFAHYLYGLQKLNADDDAAAATELDLALARGLPGTAFVRNGARQLALAAYRAHDLPRLGRAIAALYGAGTTTTDHLLADDWAERIVFDATGHL